MLLLECYPPAQKLTEPPYFCTYHGTDGLDIYTEPDDHDAAFVSRLGELRRLYSRFRPHRRGLEDGGRRVKNPAGDVPDTRTHPISPGKGRAVDKDELVRQTLSLDGHELFAQLCCVSNLVKIGPRSGLFRCFVEVEDGVLRVWRDWMARMAERGEAGRGSESMEQDRSGSGKGKEAVEENVNESPCLDDESILWVSSAKNTGLRLRIRERMSRRDAPILLRVDEDVPVSYEIVYDELLVRTSHLLLMLEKSSIQQDNCIGKAIVFGSFG
ncbi:hypothetical protein K432DRAFT_441878 [Lepidopterella palustris CBS 459.81]|uniref:Uncharacterized protein n=1 Tax=Lepidopterella palustris CBS 459.81 TaxID=1314670 RepID=A0A8E2JHD3_9PEZI|nr:hypothetical protein K432DRAFT_441878 [Lepidopterella palustris CBS 459.81]